MQTKTIILKTDELEVTFKRRTWDSVRESIRKAAHEIEAMTKEALAPEAREARLAVMRMDQQEQALSETVENWDSVRKSLSVAGFMELEKAVDDFSKAEVVAGN